MRIKPQLTENALTVLKKRYLIKNEKGEVIETPEQLFERVAKHVASCETGGEEREHWEEVFYNMMASGRFEPNTPCLVNAGRPSGQLSACFVLPLEDSMDGIFGTLHDAAKIFKSGGGVGYAFSNLRPEGDFVSTTSGIASGPVSFMHVFNAAVDAIKQGGVRRGAQMAILRVDHPDILKFIEAKKDTSKLTNFNISVAITNEFMAAVKEDRMYDLVNPRTKEVVAKQYARPIWEAIIRQAHATGEPGLFFVDRVNAADPCPHLGPVESTNPCQPGWATVLTPAGIRTLNDVSVDSIIWSGTGWTRVTKKVETGVKPVFAFETTAGVFYGTEEHRVVEEGKKIEVCRANGIDRITGPVRFTPIRDSQDVIDGLVFGDGTVHQASKTTYLCIGKNDQDLFKSEIQHYIGEQCAFKDYMYRVSTTLSMDEIKLTYEREVPDRFRYGRPDRVAGFLRGLYSANGSVVSKRVTLKASSFAVIKVVQEMLSSIGIESYYTCNRANKVKFANGTYTCRESYDLNISTDRDVFAQSIGFIQKYKQAQLQSILDTNGKEPKTTFEIMDRIYLGDYPVFDITVESDEHTYWSGGLLVSNCGEVPLQSYSSCNLGSINLAEMLTTENEIDWDRLRATVRVAVHFLDNVITVNNYPLHKIREMSDLTRKVGLGVMGWADLLYRLQIPYDSDKACELAESVMGCISGMARITTQALVSKYGRPPFGGWLGSRPQMDDDLPRRNSTTTVIAPTGTISIIAGCSGGIEPLFALTFVRNQAGVEMLEVNQEFERVAREEGWYSDDLMKLVQKRGSCRGISEVPKKWQRIFATSHDISPEWHVRMQAAFQQYTDDAVSKTINFPHDATVRDVEEAYNLAWELGCKGVTVYRDGSRPEQVLNIEKVNRTEGAQVNRAEAAPVSAAEAPKLSPEIQNPRTPKPRPRRLSGETYRFETGEGALYVTINEDDDGQPFEVFAQIGKAGGTTHAHMEALARVISLALRSGVPLEAVAKQLSGIKAEGRWDEGQFVESCPDGIAKALRLYAEGEKAAFEDLAAQLKAAGAVTEAKVDEARETLGLARCTECGGKTHKEQGCLKCDDPKCGWSKCG